MEALAESSDDQNIGTDSDCSYKESEAKPKIKPAEGTQENPIDVDKLSERDESTQTKVCKVRRADESPFCFKCGMRLGAPDVCNCYNFRPFTLSETCFNLYRFLMRYRYSVMIGLAIYLSYWFIFADSSVELCYLAY